MKNLVCFLFLVAVVFVPYNAMADKEGMLAWSNFSVESQGIGSSGPIKIYGTQTLNGITSLQIFAFNRTFTLGPQQLAELSGFVANGMQLSYAQGYKRFGGRTLYIMIFTGFTSGIEMKRIIKVNEQGKIDTGKTMQSEIGSNGG